MTAVRIETPIRSSRRRGRPARAGLVAVIATTSFLAPLSVAPTPASGGAPGPAAIVFGYEANGIQGAVRSDLEGATQVAGGAGHGVARMADGSAWAWGRNDYGQAGDSLGDDDLSDITPSGEDVVEVAAGSLHTLLLDDDGAVWALGRNECGQLGIGSTANQDVAIEITGLTDVVSIDADGNQSYALRDDGTVYHWGPDDFEVNCLGGYQSTPVPLAGLTDVTDIAAGTYHLLALHDDGTVSAVGSNGDGQLGEPTAGSSTATPVTISALSDITSIAAGWLSSFAIDDEGDLWAWGSNNLGSLGLGYHSGVEDPQTTPAAVPIIEDVVEVSHTSEYTLARTADGGAWSWGENYGGELGRGVSGDIWPYPAVNYFAGRIDRVHGATGVFAEARLVLGHLTGVQTKLMRASLGRQQDNGEAGDPVNTGTGNFFDVTVDLSTGAGTPLLTRTYNSLEPPRIPNDGLPPVGILGPGWTTELDTVLWAATADLITYRDTTGRMVDIPGDGFGSWDVPPEERATISETLDRRVLTKADGTVAEFDFQGRLHTLTRPDGDSMEVTWNGAVDTPVSAVFRRNGQTSATLTFTDSNNDDRVDRIEGPGGVRRAYTYLGGRLATVSTPHLAAGPVVVDESFTWTDGFLTEIDTALDASTTVARVTNTYDSIGRVVEQAQPDGDVTTFSYADTDLFGIRATTVTHTAGADVETLIYRHDDAGHILGIQDPDGETTSLAWDDRLLDTATTRRGAVTDRAYDGDGRIVGIAGPDPDVPGTPAETRSVIYCNGSATDRRAREGTDEAGAVTRYAYGAPTDPGYPCAGTDTTPTQVTTAYGTALAATTTIEVADDLPIEVTDPDGVVIRSRWDAARTLLLARERDPDTAAPGSEVTFYGYDTAGRRTVERSPSGIETWTVYDAAGQVTSTVGPVAAPSRGCTALADTCTFPGTPPSGPTTTSTYYRDGALASFTDAVGETTTYTRTPTLGGGREETEHRPDGSEVVTTYDAAGRVASEAVGDEAIPAEVAVTLFAYGPLGRLESVTDPTGVTTTYEYDEDGNQTAVVDEDGERTTTVYDLTGRVRSVTDPRGEVTTSDYDAAGRLVERIDRTGESTTYDYDVLGRLIGTIDARDGETTRTYTPGGRPEAVTDATGRTTTSTYDDAGQLVTEELESGATTTYGYDADGRRVTVTSPEGRVTTTTYDAAGRPLTTDTPQAGTTTATYDDRGTVLTRTDATGGVVTYTYDEMGRVATVTDPLTRVTTYDYDSRGNRVLRADARSGEREWHWNLADQLVEEIDPLDRSTTYTYDALGRLDVKTDGAGRTETYGYDEAGQVTSLTYASGTPTTFAYDEEGRRTVMTDATGTSTWYYNPTGQMTGAGRPGDRDLVFAWDLAGRRTVIQYPDGTRYRNRYDTDGRLSEVEIDDSGTWVDVAVNTYDDDGLLIEQDQGASGLREWTYDAVTGRMTGYDETRGLTTTSTTLTHDAAGRIASETTGGVTTTYDYDAAGQLELVDRSTGSDETYAYDELGRRTTAVVGATTTTYQWDAASQLNRRVVNGANHNYQYDASGRRTREAWNGGTDVIQFFWGARGNLGSQRHTTPGTVTDVSRSTRGDGTLSALTTSVNSVVIDTSSVVWDPTLPVPQPVWTGDPGTANATRAVYGPDLIRFTCPTGTGCTGPAEHDIHGSALETPATAAVTLDTGYSPWGDGGGTFTPDLDHGYRSELHSGATIHLRARDYDPDTGLFLSPDPLDGVDGTTTVNNPYHYADNDPVNRLDPLGLRPTDGDLAGACPDNFQSWEDIDEPTCTLPPAIDADDERYPFTGPHPISARCRDSMAPGGEEWYHALWQPRVHVDCSIIVSKRASTVLHLVMQEHASKSYMVRGMCGEGPLSAYGHTVNLDRSLIADSLEERLGSLRKFGVDVGCVPLLSSANGSLSASLRRAHSISGQCLELRFQVKSLGLDPGSPGDHAPPGWEQVNVNLLVGSYILIHRRDWRARGCPESYSGRTPDDFDITDVV